MVALRVGVLALLGSAVGAQSVVAQAPFRYREYALGSSIESVVALTGARAGDTRTVHERPARIERLEWRAPYTLSNGEPADPVRDVRFSFYDGQLYEIVVSYDRERTEGLTDADLVESLTAIYGEPLATPGRAARRLPSTNGIGDTMLVAHWEDATSRVMLTQGSDYRPEYQLVLISKPLDALARPAIAEALRLDLHEAPRRELERRNKDLADAREASDKARAVNKPAFRP